MESKRSKVEEKLLQELVRVWYTNVGGLMSKRLEMEEFLQRERPDVMVISETKWKSEWGIPDIGKENYDYWIMNRKDKGGGGVMILTKKGMKVVKTEISTNKAEIVKVVIENKSGKERAYVGVYVPPQTSAWKREEYEDMLNVVLQKLGEIVTEEKDFMIVGDFNCKEINWEEETCQGGENSWSDRLLNWATENLLTQWVRGETRFSGRDAPSRLDLLFTSDNEIINSVGYTCPMGKSDHVMMNISMGGKLEIIDEDYKMERYRYNKANFEEMRNYFEKVDWNSFEKEESLQGKWEEFLKIYNEALVKFVPRGRTNCKKGKEWYNGKCEKARKDKTKAWNRWRREPSGSNWGEYVETRNECVEIMRQEKHNYEKSIVDKCKSDPKLFYRHVNGKMKRKEGITGLKEEGVIYTDEQDMATVMNRNFQGVFTEEGEFELDDRIVDDNGLYEVKVYQREILKLMEGLEVNKAPGPDGVTGWILRECREQLVDKIHKLISLSLTKGELPRDWKRANIVPIYKGGSKENPLNYRPVSLLSVVGKMCEKIVKEKWMRHLEEKNVLTNCQYGFRKGRSCTANLLSYYAKVFDIVQERDGWVDSVYLDLKKAFDKVPHKRLLWKIKNYGGVGGKLLDWMKDYLSEREMRTVIRNKNSLWLKVTSGVPQGSVLGPVMFGVYVNDMVEGIDSHVNLFADDGKLMRRVKDMNDCRKLQEDLDKVGEWSKNWKMEFNSKKCKVMEFGRSKNRIHGQYKMNNVQLDKSGEEIDLGVTITENLTPDRHINKITGEVTNLLRRIKMAFSYIDGDMMRKLITSMVRPRLEYAATVWSPHTKKNIRKLERVQRAATKMVPELRDLTYEERLRELALPTLESRRVRGDLISVYKMVNGLDCLGEDLLKFDIGTTRGHSKKLKKERCLKDVKKYSFPHRVIDMWNGLEEEIVSAISVNKFKAELDKLSRRDGP